MADRIVRKILTVVVALVTIMTVLATGAFATGAWTETAIETFTGANGANPYASLIADPSGNLYGTTFQGGIVNTTYCPQSCGVVFELSNSGGVWTESVLYEFCSAANCADGFSPWGGLIMDSSGNLYGTTRQGGAHQYSGTVFELSQGASGWTETVLYSFCSVTGCTDGSYPEASLIFDSAGNLYGTTANGGYDNCSSGCGTVFELGRVSGGWTETVLYAFCSSFGCNDAFYPSARLTFDSVGNLYGTTNNGGVGGCFFTPGCGTVFELTPLSGGKWQETILHAFTGTVDGGNPYFSSVVFDSKGNLYGTTSADGTERGVVFELVAALGWREREIHLFTGGSDGAYPYAGVIFDSAGNLYGTTSGGGTYGYGVIFELKRGSDGHWGVKALHDFTHGTDGGSPYSGLIFDTAGNLYGTAWDGGDLSCPYLNGYGCGTVFELTP